MDRRRFLAVSGLGSITVMGTTALTAAPAQAV